MWYGTGISAYLASDQDLRATSTCSRATERAVITAPASANPSSLVAVAGTSTFGQKLNSTSSTQDERPVPSSILGYLDTLPEVQDQVHHIPLTSCAYLTPQPDVCTRVTTSISTSCAPGSGNLSHTSCNEQPVTVTETLSSRIVGTPVASATHTQADGGIIVPRKPAAYLTYNTLGPSDDVGTVALGQVDAPITPTPPETHDKPSQTGSDVGKITEGAGNDASPEDSQSTADPGASAGHSADTGNGESESDGSNESPDTGSQTGDGNVGNEGSNGSPNSESQTGDVNAGNAGGAGVSATKTDPFTIGTVASEPPVFTFQGQTLTVGGAVTYGGNAVSELPNHDGVAVDRDHTVLLSDGEATTLTQQDSQQSITLSRSGSAFVVNGETLSSNQQIDAGQTTASAVASGSSAVVYINGTPTSLTAAADGGSPPSSTGVGGYVNSGIGGDGASASSDVSPESATGGPGESSTGGGSSLSLGSWTCGGWMVGFFVFLSFAFLL